MSIRALLLPALAAAVLSLLPACDSGSAAPAPTSAAAPDYVGAEACRSCHPERHERWLASAHARSTRPATPDTVPPELLEEKTIVHAPGESTFRRDGDRFLVNTTGPDGARHDYPVTHVVGPHRITMFLTRMDDGRLQVLPFLREIPTGEWFDYTYLIFAVPENPWEKPPEVRPGEPSFWTGPIRAYDTRCGRCHTSGRGPRREVGENGWMRTDWDPLPIDCEACHGPGREHVEFWKNPPAEHRPDPMVNLARLSRDRAQAVCLSCHMEGDLVREGFRPGDDIFEHVTPMLLDSIERLDAAGRPLELVYDGLPFQFSECARAGGLTCVSCHDSHGSANRSDLLVPEDRTFTLCLSCHQEYAAEPGLHTHHDMTKSGGRCVSCHMPFLTIERGHGTVRDHTISVPMPDLYGGRVTTDACTWCHRRGRDAPEDSPLLETDEILAKYREWYPDAKLRPKWVETIAAGRAGDSAAAGALAAAARNLRYPRLVRASAAKLLAGNPGRSMTLLLNLAEDDDTLVRRAALAGLAGIRHPDVDYVLETALEDDSLAVRGAAARAALSGYARVEENPELLQKLIPVLEEEAEAVPLDDERWFRLGAAKEIAGDLPGALAAYRRKLALDPYAALVERTVKQMEARLAGE